MQRTVTSALKQRRGWRSLGRRWRASATTCATFWPRRGSSPTGWRPAPTPPVRRARRSWSTRSAAPSTCVRDDAGLRQGRGSPPSLSRFNLSALVSEVTEGESMAARTAPAASRSSFSPTCPASLVRRRPRSRLFRCCPTWCATPVRLSRPHASLHHRDRRGRGR